MNRSYLSFALLCSFALCGSVIGNPVGITEGIAIAKEGLVVINEGIDTLDKGFNMYNKILDKIVPWSELNKTITKLDEYRSDYSEKAATLLGDIKTKMYDGMDAYNRAVQSVYEWCGLAINLLDTYKTLFNGKMNEDKFNGARKIVLEVLEKGLVKMKVGQKELGDSSSSFNIAAGKLTQLNYQLSADFDQNSEYYQSQMNHIRLVGYGSAAPFMLLGIAIAAGVIEGKLIPELNDKMASIEKFYNQVTVDVANAFKNIDETKAKLEEEIRHIGDVKTQTESAQFHIGLDDNKELKEAILKSVNDLVTECKKYRARHIDGK